MEGPVVKRARQVQPSAMSMQGVFTRSHGNNGSSNSSSNLAPLASGTSSARPAMLSHCCSCRSDIAETKAVLLPCECKHAFCLDCAQEQMFVTVSIEKIGIDEVSVYCPSCKQRPVVSHEGKGSNLVASSVREAQSAEDALVRHIMLCFVLL